MTNIIMGKAVKLLPLMAKSPNNSSDHVSSNNILCVDEICSIPANDPKNTRPGASRGHPTCDMTLCKPLKQIDRQF